MTTKNNLKEKANPNDKTKELILLQDKILFDLARKDFKTYINLVFRTKSHSKKVKSGFDFNWLNEIIIEELEGFILNPEINNIMIFAPPRVGKSELSSMLLPSFLFGRLSQEIIRHGGPKFEVMSGSYDTKLASLACREVQKYIDSDIYRAIFPQVRIPNMGGYLYGIRHARSSLYCDIIGDITKGSLDSKFCFKPKADGTPPETRVTASYRVVHKGGSVTGFGYHLGILDDMVKSPRDIDSKLSRDQLFNWYASTFSTRQQKFNKLDTKTIILMTRWHHDDLPGRLLRQTQKSDNRDTWRVVCLPAEGYSLKDPARHPRDSRKPGEIKTIRGMDEKYFKKKKTEAGAFYSALYQQKPTSEVGEHIKRKWINFYDTEEVLDDHFNFVIGGADLSLDAVERGSYNVFLRCGVNFVTTGGVTQPHIYVLDCVREKMDYADMKMAYKQFMRKYTNWSGGFFIEKAANAYALKSEFGPSQKRLKAHDAYERLDTEFPFMNLVTVRDSKPVRVMSNIGILKYGKFFLPKLEQAEWAEHFVEELVDWPKYPTDDCVDALVVVLGVVNEKLSDLNALESMSPYQL